MDKLVLFFDGACSPFNPGGVATYGWIAENTKRKVVLSGKGLIVAGEGATNNVAEYAALEAGLVGLLEQDYSNYLEIYGDSQLVINTITDYWKCKKPHLDAYNKRIQKLLQKFSGYGAEWIPREQNTKADALSIQSYEDYLKEGNPIPKRPLYKAISTPKKHTRTFGL